MDVYEFGEKCQELNKEYKKIFGYIPNQWDFSCTWEEYLDALNHSIKEKKDIKFFLKCMIVKK